MRLDVVSIFPAYLDALDLSLPGRARSEGLLEVAVHDLRRWTRDRHRTVDDAPYGGGAGMVMRPEPWGEALDEVAPDGATLVVPGPAGEPFHQRIAADLASRQHLVFACGRYEGIDQRVIDEAGARLEVRELSLGDYVLNGGEVATLAIIEAVVRLLPGFLGNASSLAEESHGADGLLEYPVYTRPARWRDREVPSVLLSGDHAQIAAWRDREARRRTTRRRPDLMPPSGDVGDASDVLLGPAGPGDAGEVLTLQRACWMQEAQDNPGVEIPALTESLEDVRRWLGEAGGPERVVLLARRAGRLVGAVRGFARTTPAGSGRWCVGRLMVAPDLQGRGLGRMLLDRIEGSAPAGTAAYELFTGARSRRNLTMYRRAGYRPDRTGSAPPGAVLLSKPATVESR